MKILTQWCSASAWRSPCKRFTALCTGIVLAALGMASTVTHAAEQEAHANGKKKANWDIVMGAGLAHLPDYEGSDDYERRGAPLIDIEYRDFVFLRQSSLGISVLKFKDVQSNRALHAGPLLHLGRDRDENDNPALRGLGDLDISVEAGVFTNLTLGSWQFRLTLFRDISHTHDGLVAQGSVGWSFPMTPRLRASIGTSATWTDGSYMQTYFGITPGQAAASGLRPYQAGSGGKDITSSVRLEYALSNHWLLAGGFSFKRLLSDAANSPLVADVGSASQITAAAFIAYRF